MGPQQTAFYQDVVGIDISSDFAVENDERQDDDNQNNSGVSDSLMLSGTLLLGG